MDGQTPPVELTPLPDTEVQRLVLALRSRLYGLDADLSAWPEARGLAEDLDNIARRATERCRACGASR
ncbi:MAG: hypothetical protein AB7H81_23660 [Vicinamibacterales bacterium]